MKFEYTIIGKTTTELKVRVPLKTDMDCFDGHFNQIMIMPAVAQLYIVEKLSQKYFKQLANFERMNQIKFVGPICPDTVVTIDLSMNIEKQQVFFEYHEKEKLKSKGSIYYSRKQTNNE